MAAAAGIGGVLPFYVDADATPNPGGYPEGGQTPLDLPNNHLQYAITWYALAAALVVFYILLVRRRRVEADVNREPLSRPRSPLPPSRRACRRPAGVLHWDTATMMPEGGAEARGEQVATLKVVCHEILTDPALPDLLAGAEAENTLDDWQRANLREMRRALAARDGGARASSSRRCPRPCARCEMVWRQARPASDFAAVLPALRTAPRPGARGRRGQGRARWARRPMRRCSTNTSPTAAPPRSIACSTRSPRSCPASSTTRWRARRARRSRSRRRARSRSRRSARAGLT